MKKLILLSLILIAIIQLSCNKEDISYNVNNNEIAFRLTSNHSRSSEMNDSIATTEKILFNSTGNMIINNAAFTFTNNKWRCTDTKYYWNKKEKSDLYIYLLYPTTPNKEYTLNTLYSENELIDVLYAKDTIKYLSDIKIELKHLFSKLTINISDEAKKNLKTIRITIPLCIKSINTKNGDITFSENVKDILKNVDSKESFDFIIPPNNNYKIDISLIYSSKEKKLEIPTHLYESNKNYICNIGTKNDKIGIRSVEDFIAFSKLINKQEYAGEKSLKDFATEKDGKIVYKLLNDIYLSEEESKQIIPIGSYLNFYDIFDGQGHTIDGLYVQHSPFHKKYYGLFYTIDKDAKIINLTIDNATLYMNNTNNDSNMKGGIIAFMNSGIIDNCVIRNSKFICDYYGYGGVLSAYNNGTIANCGIEDCSITINKDGIIGGVSGLSNGLFINSYVNNLKVTTKKEKTYYAGIVARCMDSKKTTIANCYTNINTNNYTKCGNFIGLTYDSSIINCFYYNKYLKTYIAESTDDDNTIITDVFNYNNDFTFNNGESVIERMNSWIDSNYLNYKEINLKRWEKGDKTTPACFK